MSSCRIREPALQRRSLGSVVRKAALDEAVSPAPSGLAWRSGPSQIRHSVRTAVLWRGSTRRSCLILGSRDSAPRRCEARAIWLLAAHREAVAGWCGSLAIESMQRSNVGMRVSPGKAQRTADSQFRPPCSVCDEREVLSGSMPRLQSPSTSRRDCAADGGDGGAIRLSESRAHSPLASGETAGGRRSARCGSVEDGVDVG